MKLCDTIAEFEGIQVVITLVAELPVEQLKLGSVLRVLRARPSLVRVVTIQLARNPRTMIAQVRQHSEGKSDSQDSHLFETEAPDPYAFVRLLHDATDGEVSAADFLPASIGR